MMRKVTVEFIHSETNEKASFTVESNNIPMGVSKARYQLFRSRPTKREGWKMTKASFEPTSPRSVNDIHHDIMSGRAVSGGDLSRWCRSPKGMMHIAMMNNGR